MENNKQSSILEWFKKYILMKDLKEKSPEVLRSCIYMLIAPMLIFCSVGLLVVEMQYMHNFNNLEVLDGTVTVNHYTQKSGKYGREPVIDIHVASESKDVIYFRSPIYKSEQLFINNYKIEKQQVRVWYLPDNNKFYLIKFLHTNEFNSFDAVKETQLNLIKESNYFKFLYPLLSCLSVMVIVIIQLLLIRFEIFRNYDLYFIDQRWDWQRPVKFKPSLRVTTVFIVFSIVPWFSSMAILRGLLFLVS